MLWCWSRWELWPEAFPHWYSKGLSSVNFLWTPRRFFRLTVDNYISSVAHQCARSDAENLRAPPERCSTQRYEDFPGLSHNHCAPGTPATWESMECNADYSPTVTKVPHCPHPQPCFENASHNQQIRGIEAFVLRSWWSLGGIYSGAALDLCHSHAQPHAFLTKGLKWSTLPAPDLITSAASAGSAFLPSF